MELSNIEPQIIWKNFSKLNAVPRPSKKEEKVIAFIKEFGENLGLETTVDETGNVIIKKPATSGMENRKPIVMQSPDGSRWRLGKGKRNHFGCR